jgi:hypothetical protein
MNLIPRTGSSGHGCWSCRCSTGRMRRPARARKIAEEPGRIAPARRRRPLRYFGGGPAILLMAVAR